jgi:hypothetical protein
MKAALAGLGAGIACAVMIACGAAPQASRTSPPPTMVPANAPDRQSKMQTLVGQLEREKAEQANVPQSMAACEACDAMARVSGLDPTCQPAKTQRCEDVCKLDNSICGTKDKICDLAKDMVGDAWAQGKCDDAKKDCETSHSNCCSCS